jgi:hypothetical protein
MKIIASVCLVLAMLLIVGCATFPRRQTTIGEVIEPGIMVQLQQMDNPNLNTPVEMFIPMTIDPEYVCGVIQNADGKWNNVILPMVKFKTGVYHVTKAR